MIMNILRSVMFVLMSLIIVFISSVASEDGDNNKEVNTGKSLGNDYRYNHPPIDNFDPIPVSIVYDDGNGGISEQPDGLKNVSPKILDITPTTEENITHETSILPETTTITARKKNANQKLKPKPRRLSEVQIPVAVVYEDDTGVGKAKTNSVTDKPKKGSHQRQRTEIKRKASSNRQVRKENLTTEKTTEKAIEKTTEKAVTIKPRTFPKRLSGRDPVVPIIDSESYVYSHSGNFHYRYLNGDGTRAYSEGRLKKVDEGRGEAVKGGFSYTDKDGTDYSISYTADENGYRPVGAHLPTPPPIPPAIARALAYLATATPEPVTKRSSKID